MDEKEFTEFDLCAFKAASEIKEKAWSQAMKTLYSGLCSASFETASISGKRLMTRQFAEIKLALESKMSVNEVVYWETFLFSKVSPNDWLNGSLGIAAEITKTSSSSSRIGDMVPIPCQNGVLKPFLVTSNFWCALCNQQDCTQVCSGCRVYYCSVEHQKAHWPLHKLACLQTKNPIFFNKELYVSELTVLEELYKKEKESSK